MENIVKKSFPVTGMSCASCASSVESMLRSQAGVLVASVNFAASNVWVEYNTGVVNANKLKENLQSFGYDLIIDEHAAKEQQETAWLEPQILKQKTLRAS